MSKTFVLHMTARAVMWGRNLNRWCPAALSDSRRNAAIASGCISYSPHSVRSCAARLPGGALARIIIPSVSGLAKARETFLVQLCVRPDPAQVAEKVTAGTHL